MLNIVSQKTDLVAFVFIIITIPLTRDPTQLIERQEVCNRMPLTQDVMVLYCCSNEDGCNKVESTCSSSCIYAFHSVLLSEHLDFSALSSLFESSTQDQT